MDGRINWGPLLEFAALLALATAFYAAAWRYADRLSTRRYRLVWGASFGFVVYWLAMFMIPWTDLHTVTARLLDLRANPWLDWTAPLVGPWCALIGRTSQRRHPRKSACARHNGLVLACLMIAPTFLPIIPGPGHPRWIDEWKDGICSQSDGWTCGPAVTATLLRMNGDTTITEQRAAGLVNLSERGGTPVWAIARALRARGLRARFRNIGDDFVNAPVPSVMTVRIGGPRGIGHVMLLLGVHGDRLDLADPLAGRFTWDRKQFFENYAFSGLVLHVTRTK